MAPGTRSPTLIVEQDFYRQERQLIFSAISSLAVPINRSISSRWPRNWIAGTMLGRRWTRLSRHAGQRHAERGEQAYAAIVREQSVIRQRSGWAARSPMHFYRPKAAKVHELLDRRELWCSRSPSNEARGDGGFRSISRLLTETINRIEELYGSDDARPVSPAASRISTARPPACRIPT